MVDDFGVASSAGSCDAEKDGVFVLVHALRWGFCGNDWVQNGSCAEICSGFCLPRSNHCGVMPSFELGSPRRGGNEMWWVKPSGFGVNDYRFYPLIGIIMIGIVHWYYYLHLGNSRDTTEFACDSIRQWWQQLGQFYYAFAKSILLLCDGGGSNSSNYYIFKKEYLQKFATEIGIEIRVAHYPPHTSKFNPIDHRLFPHITRAYQGATLTVLS